MQTIQWFYDINIGSPSLQQLSEDLSILKHCCRKKKKKILFQMLPLRGCNGVSFPKDSVYDTCIWLKAVKMQALCWLWLWRGARALSPTFPCFKTFSPVWFPFVDPHNAADTLSFGNCEVTFKSTYCCLQTREYFPLKSLKSVQVKTDEKDETFWSFSDFPIECLMQMCVIIHEMKPACPRSLWAYSSSLLGLSKTSCF